MNASTTMRCTGGLGLKDVMDLDPSLDVSTKNSGLRSSKVFPTQSSGLRSTSF